MEHRRLMTVALLKAEDKLEAIKDVLKEPVKHPGSTDPGDMAGVINDLHEKLSKIEEILETEG